MRSAKKNKAKKKKGPRKKKSLKKSGKGAKAKKGQKNASAEIAAKALPVRKEQIPIELPKDPWSKYKSPYGGNLSPADEWNRLILLRNGNKSQSQSVAVNIGGMTTADAENAIHNALKAGTSHKPNEVDAAKDDGAVETTTENQTQQQTLKLEELSQSHMDIKGHEISDKLILQECMNGKIGNALASTIPFSACMRAHLISLDLTDTNVTNRAISSVGPCWIRELFLASSAVDALPVLVHFPRLLKLNLDNNPQIKFLEKTALNSMPNLRSLGLRCCGLTTLGHDIDIGNAEKAMANGQGKDVKVESVLSKLMFLEVTTGAS